MSHRTDPRRGRLPAVASLALLAVLVVAACGPSNPSASPSAAATPTPAASPPRPHRPPRPPRRQEAPTRPADAVYDAVEQQVVAIRGLKPSRPVERQFIDEAELRTLLTKQFDKDTPPAYLAANERLYKALGLIPATPSLRDLSLDLLSGGVAGFYRERRGQALRRLEERSAGPERAVLLLPRVRPRAPGPELHGLQGPGRGPRPERPDARPRSPSTRATRPC